MKVLVLGAGVTGLGLVMVAMLLLRPRGLFGQRDA